MDPRRPPGAFRLPQPDPEATSAPSATLHIAVVADDARAADHIRHHAYIIQPPYWEGEVKLHILIKRPDDSDPLLMLLRVAAVQLGLVDPQVAQLHDDDQMEMGWT